MPNKLPKAKCLAFLKIADALNDKNIECSLISTELGGQALFKHLELVSKTVMLPILSNLLNQQMWGEVTTRELTDCFHSFLSSTSILCGQVKGETHLPLPPLDGESGVLSATQNRTSLLEASIVTWTRQIKNVLKQDPESQMKRSFHPSPVIEIEFWKKKSKNLNAIFEQLQGEKIRRVLRALDQAKSTYCTNFAPLCKEVFNARLEANDNVKYLQILEKWIQKLDENQDFPSLKYLFKPLLHTILLIWKTSGHYNKPSRLVVLIQEICNSLIKQACCYVSGEQIFSLLENDEASVAIEHLKTALFVCGLFKTYYFEYKAKSVTECPTNPWKIQNNALFVCLNSFVERCHDVLDLTQTIVQFSKLSKIEVGGIKGMVLTETVQKIHHDFQNALNNIIEVEYDIMDSNAKKFDDDYFEFKRLVKEMEQRLGAVICIGLNACPTVYGRFQLLDSFNGELIDRTIIKDELENKYIDLLHAYAEDLQQVQELFFIHKESPPRETTQNLPPIAGALTWCRGLLQRVMLPIKKLHQLDKTVLDREEAKDVIKAQAVTVLLLKEYEVQRIKEWGQDVEKSSDTKLRLPLLLRFEDRILATNFDPTLVCLLREVKYFLLLGLPVPASALNVFKSSEKFRYWTGNLDLIVSMNNSVLNQLLPVEKPLVAPFLAKFDKVVEKGIISLNWRSDCIDVFIKEAMDQVQHVHDILKTMKDNKSMIESTLKKWNRPMIDRKTKPMEKDEFERSINSLKKTCFAEIKGSGKHIHHLLKETNKILRVSNASLDWRSYVEFINNIVIEGLSNTITTSLDYLFQQIDPMSISNNGKLPLLELKLVLDSETNVLDFTPKLGQSKNGEGIMDMIENIVGSFFQISTLFKRLDSEGSYLREMHSDITINAYLAMLSDAIIDNIDECFKLKKTFEKHSYLWDTDLPTYFAKFCVDATTTTEDGTKLLDLNKFDEAINKFKAVQEAVAKYHSPTDIGWIRIDITLAKQQISQYTIKWTNMYTKYMLENVTTTLTSQHEFLESVSHGLDQKVLENNEKNENLMSVMAVIRDVRKKMESFTELSGPQNSCVQILRSHGVDVLNATVAGQSLQDFLEEVPMVWETVVKKTFKKKEEILPMQIDSIDSLKVDLEEFYLSIREFRNDFRMNAPFKFNGDCSDAYKLLDSYASKLDDLDIKIQRFHELEELFELQQTNYPEIGETRTEMKQLKSLWDFKAMVSLIYLSWRALLWRDVDTEDLEEQNKQIRKQLKERGNFFPVIKGWQVYRDIDDVMTVMSIVLPLVNDLHLDAMRSRHWSSLARVCNVKIVNPKDKCFSLNDMMILNLHQHKEAIEDIVETAMKELKIERKLKEIKELWAGMEIDYESHKDTEMFVPRPSEEVVENMEAHQMELQGIYGMGKFMEYFKDRVIYWQSLLRTVDDTLRMWMVVSKYWASLESIFLSSADIRSQLPEDTKRFEKIDSEFKELMKEAVTESNCVIVCSTEGRCDALKDMRDRLELCQKSLNEYLDIKKKIFPRFYFVSSVALLDMLANGTHPPKIMPYLGDCYDALSNLKFVALKNGQVSDKTTSLMIAKDGEEVLLSELFTMEGEVESYLNQLTLAMQNSLKNILSDAIEKAASWEIDTPRHEWLFNYPAQLCITGTQIYWTDETQLALEEYEGGQDDAVKRHLQICNSRLSALINLVLGELSSANRTKIISLITMDVHSRDVVDRLVSQKTDGPSSFAWQQQLRFEWDQPNLDVDVKICDFQCKYFYEWVGNTGRLVITPLTDRCYITLTMGLKLFLGGAPAGPAGTGKTETTKDLARALAIPCYVFNCSDQMNFQTMADIFRGLAQTGAWGCFDEFNRIPIEVLSVVATQVKTIQDAIVKFSKPENREEEFKGLPSGTPPAKVGDFDFMGDSISLIPTCGFWITMNPGYAGRTELPENLKVLFRSCAMIRPDMKLIQENMLMAEGFQTARSLSVKFNTLYELSSALLSKQPHYDWGLRAVKSVLRVAGGMKRANPGLDEAQVLMRALRDFNTPKIPNHDMPIFLRLINDLFMGLTVDSKVDEDLKTKIIRVAKSQGLQFDEMFINKTCNFQELLDVRHSVMLLGPAGCAKTTIWKTLQATHNLDKPKPVCVVETVNPKSVSGDELYGYMTLAKDWKDGVLSIIMRGMSKNVSDQGFYIHQTNKWVVLDGDIDAVWIESMNTVMDDNKVLTLVSNERVPLSPSMRMVFEINSLKNATPATVSRAGILYINESDIGWRPFMETWVQSRKSAIERNFLPALFDRYVDTLVEMTRKGYKEVTSLRLISKVSTIAYLLEGLLPSVPDEKLNSDNIEMIFAYCAIWDFGGPMIVDKSEDYRKNLSEDFLSAFNIKFPKDGLCFDYFFDPKSGEYLPWQSQIVKHVSVPIGNKNNETPFNSLSVETVETCRMAYILNLLSRNGNYAMFVGNTGTGKTEIIKNYLGSLNKETDGIISKDIVMNYYTSSFSLQQEMEGYIDKRSGSMF